MPGGTGFQGDSTGGGRGPGGMLRLLRWIRTVLILSLATGLGASLPAEVGTPFLRVFSAREYGAFYQNWATVEAPNGLIYVGNNSGILEYDGARWRLIRTPKGALIHALGVDPEGRIHAGGRGEYGVLEPDASGQMRFVSRMDLLPEPDRVLADPLTLDFHQGFTWIQTREGLFRLDARNQVRAWRPEGTFRFAQRIEGRLYLQDAKRGLLVLDGETLRPVPGGARFTEEPIRGMVPWKGPDGGGTALLATRSQGLWALREDQVVPFPTPLDAELKADQLWHALALRDGSLALGTFHGGLLHLGPDGALLRRLTKKDGLPSESVKHLFQDTHGGLWLALQKGLCRLELPAPLSRYDDATGLPGTALTLHRHRNQLYAGTDQGLFRLDPQAPGGAAFTAVPGIQGGVRHLASWDTTLIIACADGVFALEGPNLVPIRTTIPANSYVTLRSRRQPDLLFIGLQTGLALCRREGARWVDLGTLPGLSLHVRTLLEMPDGRLWVGTNAQGVLRLTFPDGPGSGPPQVERYGMDRGLPSLNHTYVQDLAGRIRVATHAGLYRYREDLDRFEPDPAFAGLFPEGPRWVYSPTEDPQGRIWMHSFDEARGHHASGVALPGPDGRYQWDPRPCGRFGGTWVEGLLCEQDGVVWFASAEGVIRLDSTLPHPGVRPFQTLLRAIHLPGGRSLSPLARDPRLPYRDNRLRFEFAAPGCIGDVQYQVLLEGEDTAWSSWSPEPFRDRTNLPEGSYRFRVRARNAQGVLGTEATYAFAIRPPWHRTWIAYLGAGAAFLGLARGAVRRRTRALHQRNEALEARVRERTRDLEARNQELEAMDGTVQSINLETALQPLLEALLQHSHHLVPQAESGQILLLEAPGAFQVKATFGHPCPPGPLQAPGAEVPLAQGSQMLAQGVFLQQAPQPGTGADSPDGQPGARLLITLAVGDELKGLLLLDHPRDPEAFQATDGERLRRFRAHAAIALGKAEMLYQLDAAATQLRDLNAQKNQFLGIVAHDLRSPLNSIVMAAQLLDGEEDPQETSRVARMIHTEGQDMSTLIGRLLDVAAIEAGTLPMEPQALDLARVVRHVLGRHEAAAARKGITFSVEAPELPVLAWADPKFTKEIADNLVSNALKFSFKESRIMVRIEAHPQVVRLSILDQGPGLTSEDQARIFGRYAKLSARPTGGEKSTGLGLSIVKHMVEAMHGRVWAESRPGEGATFHVELPVPPEA